MGAEKLVFVPLPILCQELAVITLPYLRPQLLLEPQVSKFQCCSSLTFSELGSVTALAHPGMLRCFLVCLNPTCFFLNSSSFKFSLITPFEQWPWQKLTFRCGQWRKEEEGGNQNCWVECLWNQGDSLCYTFFRRMNKEGSLKPGCCIYIKGYENKYDEIRCSYSGNLWGVMKRME